MNDGLSLDSLRRTDVEELGTLLWMHLWRTCKHLPLDERLRFIRRQHLAAQVAYTTWLLQGEVMNGGFHQYFVNNAGSYAYDCLLHLWLVGAPKARRMLDTALKLVNREGLPPAEFGQALRAGLVTWLYDDDSLFEPLGQLDDEFYRYEEDLDQLVGLYIREREAELAGEYG